MQGPVFQLLLLKGLICECLQVARLLLRKLVVRPLLQQVLVRLVRVVVAATFQVLDHFPHFHYHMSRRRVIVNGMVVCLGEMYIGVAVEGLVAFSCSCLNLPFSHCSLNNPLPRCSLDSMYSHSRIHANQHPHIAFPLYTFPSAYPTSHNGPQSQPISS